MKFLLLNATMFLATSVFAGSLHLKTGTEIIDSITILTGIDPTAFPQNDPLNIEVRKALSSLPRLGNWLELSDRTFTAVSAVSFQFCTKLITKEFQLTPEKRTIFTMIQNECGFEKNVQKDSINALSNKFWNRATNDAEANEFLDLLEATYQARGKNCSGVKHALTMACASSFTSLEVLAL